MTPLQQQGALCKAAGRTLATAGTTRKNEALSAIAEILSERQDEWLAANAADVAAAKEAGMIPSMLDRLTLTPQRVADIVSAVRQVIALPDPVRAGGPDGDPAQRSHHRTAAGAPGRHRHHL